MDSLLARLAPEPGPDPAVVVFGNSAGGQFVNRYAAVGRGPDVLAARGLRVRFVVANPSTYLYFGRERPVAVPDAAHVNDWRYGFDHAPGYVDATPETAEPGALSRPRRHDRARRAGQRRRLAAARGEPGGDGPGCEPAGPRPALRPARPRAGPRRRAPVPAPADPAGGCRARGRGRAGRPANAGDRVRRPAGAAVRHGRSCWRRTSPPPRPARRRPPRRHGPGAAR